MSTTVIHDTLNTTMIHSGAKNHANTKNQRTKHNKITELNNHSRNLFVIILGFSHVFFRFWNSCTSVRFGEKRGEVLWMCVDPFGSIRLVMQRTVFVCVVSSLRYYLRFVYFHPLRILSLPTSAVCFHTCVCVCAYYSSQVPSSQARSSLRKLNFKSS